MAAITSLGIHKPTGLQHLIASGHLPQSPRLDLYHWETYVSHSKNGDIEEEVLYTKSSVVWSQAHAVRVVYRFNLENEDVQQAFLTDFPPNIGLSSTRLRHGLAVAAKAVSGTTETSGCESNGAMSFRHDEGRALAVLLKSKLHVYFMSGSHHVVDVPFAVHRAFPAPRGIILSRAKTSLAPLSQTPRVPPPPQNSFFSSQLSMRSSQLHSPTLQKSLGKTNSRLGTTSTNEKQLDQLWQSMLSSPSHAQQDDEDMTFTLTDPFSEPGLVTEANRSPILRLSDRSKQAPNIHFDALDPAEHVVYISPRDELQHYNSLSSDNQGSLILLVTFNADRGTLTLWHGWYLHEKSLLDLMKKRDEAKAEKARRRSSLLSASIGTGATTPAVRNREALRESFAAMSQLTATATRKVTAQSGEATMASQLDPDFGIQGTQQSTKEVSRRISSLVSRTEPVLPSTTSASFGAGAYRRGTSFGGQNERRSYGLRRSRGSTPGSVLNRSLGVEEEDMMEFEDESQFDLDEAVTDSLQLIRATYDATGAETLLGTLEGGWKRDLVVQRLHVCTLDYSSNRTDTQQDTIKVTTLQQSQYCTKTEDIHTTVYLHDALSKVLFSISLQVKQQLLYPDHANLIYVAVPVVKSHKQETVTNDIIRIHDCGTNAILLGELGVRFAGSGITTIVCGPPAYRLQNPYPSIKESTMSAVDVGRNRTVTIPRGSFSLSNASLAGRFDECFSDGSLHRQAINLKPVDSINDAILRICEVVLSAELAHRIRPTWLAMHQILLTRPESMAGTVCSAETIATVAAVFAQVLNLLDERSKAALRLARVAASNQSTYQQTMLRLIQHERAVVLDTRSAWAALNRSRSDDAHTLSSLDQALPIAIALADDFTMLIPSAELPQHVLSAMKLILGLHILAEESMFNICSHPSSTTILAPIISQLGQWLNLDAWSSHLGSYYDVGGASAMHWSFVRSTAYKHINMEIMETPIGVFEWLEHSIAHKSAEQYPTLSQITQLGLESNLPAWFVTSTDKLTPRTTMMSNILKSTLAFTLPPRGIVEAMAEHSMTIDMLESLPDGVAAPLREAIAQCERNPPGSWSPKLLRLVGRDDLVPGRDSGVAMTSAHPTVIRHDVNAACIAAELPASITKTREADRNAISQLIFPSDRRLVDAASMLHFNTVQIGQCVKQSDWSDAHYFEQQRRVMQFVTVRMIALPAGDGLLHFNSQCPLMTERYHLPGFSSSCIMQPIGHTVTTDRSGLTEDKVNWAYFHAGVSAGLRISKHATGIDTSWLVFNKPSELTNRHAGLLLALGLNGHLRHLAKWLSFKYLTPKHSMTSLGLLLGLAASHLGSMDGLITRMLSVHISCMLPHGAAELNVSPLTQTAGLLGIGLLYYNTQHRRMTETMLQEIETTGIDDPDCGPDALRDESYRLAAGFALGFINLGRSKDLRGLHGVQLQERLLRIAVGPRPVHAVHILDQATAGATMAVALIYMKSRDAAIARQIDVPDTEAQFENVRPDVLMLRVLAKHIILWDSIQGDLASKKSEGPLWIPQNLPKCCRSKWAEANSSRCALRSSDLPFYYILTGLCLAMGLKYAGSGHKGARNEILGTLELLRTIQKKTIDSHHFYDSKMARSAVRRCIDVLALAAATVMSGTGDLQTFRHLRRLHGRTDADTPYGSHLAAHMGIGVLFMGGGTCTFGTSNLAIASLMCSLYPLFPVDVHDNKVHLQAFRHLWVFAVEPRCLIAEDIDTGRPIKMPITLRTREGRAIKMQSPCLLPDLDTISTIWTTDSSFWRITLDFAQNPEHLRRFKANQRVSVRRCPAWEAHDRIFWATFTAAPSVADTRQIMAGIHGWVLGILHDVDRGELELILPSDEHSPSAIQGSGTKIDDILTLRSVVNSDARDKLWDLRVLLAWATRLTTEGHGNTRWLGRQLLAQIDCDVDERRRRN